MTTAGVPTPAVARSEAGRQGLVAAIGLLLYLGLVFSFYGQALTLGWCCDDTQILLHASRHAPWRWFIEPDTWRALVPFSLTPWLSLSYRIDLALFGFNPAAFHAHHLVVLALCAWMIHRLVRPWAGEAAGAAGGLLFLAGVPAAQASQVLMVRHYLEGLLALLLTLWLVRRQSQAPRAWRPVLIALSYAVAATAKEVFLPLGLVAWLWAAGPWQNRLRSTAPVWLLMALYVPWRGYMLGELLGGYTPSGDLTGSHRLADSLQQFLQVPALLTARPAPALALLAALGVAGGLAWWRLQGGRALLRVTLLHLGVALLLLVPLLPLTVFPGIGPGSERYFIAAWAALAIAVALWLGQAAALRQGTARRLLSALLLLGLLVAAWPLSRQSLLEMARLHREHGTHFSLLTEGGAGDTLIASPSVSAWFIEGALELRPALGPRGAMPGVMVDEAQLVGPQPPGQKLWQLDLSGQRLVDAAPGLTARLDAWRPRLRVRPMQVAITYDGPTRALRWQLGPGAPGGHYTLLAHSQRLVVPFAQGALRIEKPLPPCFRVRHDAPDGSLSYTPWLRLAMSTREHSALNWQGRSDDLEALKAAPRCPG